MITIYSTLKPCKKDDRFDVIQYNAIMSWKELDVEILITGVELETIEFCQHHKIKHYHCECNQNNIPYMDSMIQEAEKISKNNTLLLLASDTIIFNDTLNAAQILNENFSEYCGGVRRFDAPIPNRLNFDTDWKTECKKDIKKGHPSAGDYFLHTKNYWNGIPNFVIGRARLDNWMFWHAANIKKSLINLTESVLSIHPHHDHSHVVGNKITKTKEFRENDKLAGKNLARIEDANYKLVNGELYANKLV